MRIVTTLRRSMAALATAAALSAHASIRPVGLEAMEPPRWNVEDVVAELALDTLARAEELPLPVEEIALYEVKPVVASPPKRHLMSAIKTPPQPTTVAVRQDAPVDLTASLPMLAQEEVVAAELVLPIQAENLPVPLPITKTLPMLPAPAPTAVALLLAPREAVEVPPPAAVVEALLAPEEETLEDRLFKPYFELASLWFSAATAFIPSLEA